MTQSAAGLTLAIASGAPTTWDALGFAAQTHKLIGKVKNLGEFGKQFEIISNNYLTQRGTEKRKGTWNAGQLTVELDIKAGDAGQTLCETALDDDADYTFRVVFQGGATHYLRGLVTSFRVQSGGPNEMVRGSLQIELNPFVTTAGDEVASLKAA